MEKIKLPESVVQRAANAAKAMRAQAAPPASESSQSRAAFYSRRYGGGYRTARKAFTCNQFGCFRRIEPGTSYFDTMEVTEFPKTKRICAACAEEHT